MLFRALLDQGSLAVGVMDATGRLTLMSRGLQTLVGTSAKGATIAELPKLLHLYQAEGTALLNPEELSLARAATGETVRDAVISMRRPGAPVRYLRCDAMPLSGPDSHYRGGIVLVVDITAEHAAASRQDTIRGLLLDTVNHELRTPLTVVLANAELIIDTEHDVPEHLHGPLAAIVRASERLRDTIQHVSDLVDLEAVAHTVRSNTNVRELLLEVAGRRQDHADTRTVSIALDCSASLNWSLDAALVKRAVGALVDNAIAYGPNHSEVTISADITDDLLRVRVIDGGHGIPVHERERLMQPFERGAASTDDVRHSRGLGLTLAQGVATSHNGAMLLKNHEPIGFTASLMLA